MQRVVCLYLHGFLSSGNSFKAKWLKQHCLQDRTLNIIDFRTPSYTLLSPEKSVAEIEHELQTLKSDYPEAKIILIGSSMGGFYVQYLAHRHKLPYAMINPALHPQGLFPKYLGEHFNPHSGETIRIDHTYLEALKNYDISVPDEELCSLMAVDLGDEVVNIQAAIEKYRAKERCHSLAAFEGGDHAFQHLEAFCDEFRLFVENLLSVN
ncbi:YqiA/YcfP family alpha/beta fold hydrolase [Thiomicrorhabdus sp.]|uniref:YqiA/YcfP family alpha/beta fold hydrolase n=1 Tax=Thiomicrorhabdus sp. TaxID=2039724 RepID=UPI0029C8999E|nr:YqiA/YcfP family alpha/beta fold hydrolase [Thiomicrorhabdus sp.]